MEMARAEMEADLERQKLEFEREKLAQEAKLAAEKADADYDRSMLEAAANDRKSKRDLIGKVLDFIGRVLVAVLTIAVGIIQVKGITREEENDTFVNSKSLSFWTKGNTKY